MDAVREDMEVVSDTVAGAGDRVRRRQIISWNDP